MKMPDKSIGLKSLLKAAHISLADFAELVSRETGMGFSKASAYLLVNKGQALKKAPDFKEKINGVINKHYAHIMAEIGTDIEQIWNENKKDEEKDMATKKYEVLTEDAKRHFGVRQDPFPISLSKMSDFLRLGSHLEALFMMEAAADNGGLVAISGKVGSGKTSVFLVFEEQNRTEQRYNIITPKSMDTAKLTIKDIQHSIVYHLSEQNPKRSQEALGWQVDKLLKARLSNGEKTVLVIDEAHRLHLSTLKALKNLWEKRDGMTNMIGIILIGQEELWDRLFGRGNTEIREVAARITHIRLEPINNELEAYLTHKIKMAKCDILKVIQPDAIKYLAGRLIEEDKNGIKDDNAYPLDIDNTVKRLMNYCAMAGEPIITIDVIKTVGI